MFSILPPWNWWKPWHSILTWTDNGQISANSFLFWNDIALLQNMQAVAAAARLLYVIVKQIMQIYCKINSHTTKKKNSNTRFLSSKVSKRYCIWGMLGFTFELKHSSKNGYAFNSLLWKTTSHIEFPPWGIFARLKIPSQFLKSWLSTSRAAL